MKPHSTIYLLGPTRDLLNPFYHFLLQQWYKTYCDSGENGLDTISRLKVGDTVRAVSSLNLRSTGETANPLSKTNPSGKQP